jgi:hypothetical protein
MTPDEMVGAALAVAVEGLAAGEHRREESRDLYRRWRTTAPPGVMRDWVDTLLEAGT